MSRDSSRFNFVYFARLERVVLLLDADEVLLFFLLGNVDDDLREPLLLVFDRRLLGERPVPSTVPCTVNLPLSAFQKAGVVGVHCHAPSWSKCGSLT
jgi:hypothetical protein